MTVVGSEHVVPARRNPGWVDLRVNGRRVEVLTVGTGTPVVFLHGWGLSPRTYRGALTALAARGFQIIAPSLPGFGRSTAGSRTEQTLNGVAEHMATVIESLGLAHPVPILGHSFGGGVALRVASRHPELFTSATLVCAVGGAGDGTASWIGMLRDPTVDRHPKNNALALLDASTAWLRNPLAVAVSGLSARSADLLDDARTARAAGLPLRFIFADRDTVVRPGGLATCADGIDTEIVPGRHNWLITEPQRFADLVADRICSPVPPC